MTSWNKAVNDLLNWFETGLVDPFFCENKFVVIAYVGEKCRRYTDNDKYDLEIGIDHNNIVIDVVTTTKTLKPIVITKELIEKTINSWDMFD